LAGEVGPGVELDPGGSVQLGRLPLLHGGWHQEATGQDRYIQRDQRRRTTEESGQLPQRNSVKVRRPSIAADRRRGTTQAQPKSTIVVTRGRPRMGQTDRFQRVLQELRGQPSGW